MPITAPAHLSSAIDGYIAQQTAALRIVLLRELAAIGEEVVNTARQRGSYTDRTGNLRSSTGYVVVADGAVVVESDFSVVNDGAAGAATGRDYALSLARNFPREVALIVVAGMHYASYVAAKGFDVLDSAELQAEKAVPAMLNDLGLK